MFLLNITYLTSGDWFRCAQIMQRGQIKVIPEIFLELKSETKSLSGCGSPGVASLPTVSSYAFCHMVPDGLQ